MSYLKRFNRRRTPQCEPLTNQVANSAGGYAYEVDDLTRLRRFLVLGSEGGSYYANERALTHENATSVQRAIEDHGVRAVALIAEVSTNGRAPKNDPALFALAMAAGLGDEDTRRAALDVLPQVARTGTHLFAFASYVEQFRGWGRSLRRGVGRWYAGQDVERLAYQAVKYRQRDGMTHRDLLRLAHPAKAVTNGNPTLDVSDAHTDLFEWIVRGTRKENLPRIVEGFVRAQGATSPAETAKLVRDYRLPREALVSDHLTSPEVWDALLEDMPMTALVRNLATMTRTGLITPGSTATQRVVDQLADRDRLRRARVHPIALLSALRTYQAGRGVRGRHEWNPVTQVVDALDGAFYASFGDVEPTGRRLMLALDVSGSMTCGAIAGVPGLTPRDASAALAMVTAATESRYEIVGFYAGKGGWSEGRRRYSGWGDDGLSPLTISPRQRLDDIVGTMDGLPFGATDCALPMLYATAMEREIDTFVIYTDSETWFGDVHPVQALAEYRRVSGIHARLVVVGMVANAFSIADPEDAGMLDVVGFDTATPQLISDFARGEL